MLFIIPETGLSPQVKYSTDRSKAVLLLRIFYVFFFCLVFVMPLCASVYLCLMFTCWEIELTSWLSFVVYNCAIAILGQV